MGSDISSNYINPKTLFSFGFWIVKKAQHVQTGQKVSLWCVDYPKLKAAERNTSERHAFMDSLVAAVKMQQKIQHVNVLKIHEFTENREKFAFAAEPVKFQCFDSPKFTRDEAISISRQLARVMKFLNDDSHIAFLSLCPEAIYLDKSMNLKLNLFISSKEFKDPTQPITMFQPYAPNSFNVKACYAAPEVIRRETITIKADVFMYALMVFYLFTNKNALEATSEADYNSQRPLQQLDLLPEEFQDMVRPCLNQVVSIRPSFASIIADDAFSSIVSDVFSYVEVLDTKEQKDVFSFLVGLTDIITYFSERMQEYLLTPCLVKLVLKDKRFALASLNMLVIMSKCMTKQKIFSKILSPLVNLFSNPDSPVIAKSILENISFVTDNIAVNQYQAYVYPSIYIALESNNDELSSLGLQELENISEFIPSSEIKTNILPQISKMLSNIKNEPSALLCLKAIRMISSKVDHDTIATKTIPHILALWRKSPWIALAEYTINILYSLTIGQESYMKLSLPFASEVLANQTLNKDLQIKYFNYSVNGLLSVMKERGIPFKSEEMDGIAESREVISQKADPFKPSNIKKYDKKSRDPSESYSSKTPQPLNKDETGYINNHAQEDESSPFSTIPSKNNDSISFEFPSNSGASSNIPLKSRPNQNDLDFNDSVPFSSRNSTVTAKSTGTAFNDNNTQDSNRDNEVFSANNSVDGGNIGFSRALSSTPKSPSSNVPSSNMFDIFSNSNAQQNKPNSQNSSNMLGSAFASTHENQQPQTNNLPLNQNDMFSQPFSPQKTAPINQTQGQFDIFSKPTTTSSDNPSPNQFDNVFPRPASKIQSNQSNSFDLFSKSTTQPPPSPSNQSQGQFDMFGPTIFQPQNASSAQFSDAFTRSPSPQAETSFNYFGQSNFSNPSQKPPQSNAGDDDPFAGFDFQ